MFSNPLMFAALGAFVACGFAVWGLRLVVQVHERMRGFAGFDGMHFEI